MSLVVFDFPVPVSTPLGHGYILYVKSNPIYNNDEITCVLFETGEIKHFTSDMIFVTKNSTYSINIKDKLKNDGGANK